MLASDDHCAVVTVGVDGSAGGARAQQWAENYARQTGARLHLLTACDPPPVMGAPAPIFYGVSAPLYGVPSPAAMVSHREQENRAAQISQQALSSCRLPRDQVDNTIVMTAPRLAMKAASESSALLVLGSHGHGAVAGTLLGSVSTFCLHHAACPIVVVPSDTHPREWERVRRRQSLGAYKAGL